MWGQTVAFSSMSLHFFINTYFNLSGEVGDILYFVIIHISYLIILKYSTHEALNFFYINHGDQRVLLKSK